MKKIFSFFLLITILSLLYIYNQSDNESRFESISNLRVGLNSIPRSLNVSDTTSDINSYRILTAVHMGLVRTDTTGRSYPAVASAWKIANQGKLYSFNLRKNLKFHDGSNLDCTDVKWSIERLRNRASIIPIANKILNIECPSPHVVEFYLSKASELFLSWLSSLEASIIPKDFRSETSNTLIGLGPYYVEGDLNGYPSLKLNKDHFLAHDWSSKKIEFIKIDKASEGTRLVDTGKIDFFALEGQKNRSSNSFVFRSKAFDKVWLLLFGQNMRKSLNNGLVTCINYTIDRQKLIEARNSGGVSEDYKKSYGLVSPGQTNRLRKLPNRSIEDCKIDIKRKSLDLNYINGFVNKKYLAELVRQFAQMGIVINTVGMTKRNFVLSLIKFEYDISLVAFGVDVLPEFTLSLFYRPKSPVPLIWQRDDNVSKMLDSLLLSSKAVIRKDLLLKLEEYLAKNSYMVPIMFERTKYLLNRCYRINQRTWSVGNEYFYEIGKLFNCSLRK
jgi:MarR-like DNA-binding transcriptional regulator SgrR of sgrS sRNA